MSEFVERQESVRARLHIWLGLIGVLVLFGGLEVHTWWVKRTHFREFVTFCESTHEPVQCASLIQARGAQCYVANHPDREFKKHRLPDERRWRGRQSFYQCVMVKQLPGR
ncbi:MAG: hypothetical protein VX589_15940 [Myxococcota bacterium]|nr:hypothetical protein [Myxococcota bacterium]